MSVRHRIAVPVLAAALGLTLTGCGTSESGSSSASSSSGSGSVADASALDKAKVSGGEAEVAPAVTLGTKPLSVGETTTKVLKEGTGTASTTKDVVLVKYVLLNGTDGALINDNYAADPVGFLMSDGELIAGLRTALTGVKPGSRLLVAMPPKDAFGAQGNADIKVAPTDTVVFLFDVIKMMRPLPVAMARPSRPGRLPTVKFNDGKPATFTMPKDDAPTKLVVQPLIEGTGAKVAEGVGDRQLHGALWRTVRSSTRASTGVEHSPSRWVRRKSSWLDKGVAGATIGSWLLLIVPPSEGYGEEGSATSRHRHHRLCRRRPWRLQPPFDPAPTTASQRLEHSCPMTSRPSAPKSTFPTVPCPRSGHRGHQARRGRRTSGSSIRAHYVGVALDRRRV